MTSHVYFIYVISVLGIVMCRVAWARQDQSHCFLINVCVPWSWGRALTASSSSRSGIVAGVRSRQEHSRVFDVECGRCMLCAVPPRRRGRRHCGRRSGRSLGIRQSPLIHPTPKQSRHQFQHCGEKPSALELILKYKKLLHKPKQHPMGTRGHVLRARSRMTFDRRWPQRRARGH